MNHIRKTLMSITFAASVLISPYSLGDDAATDSHFQKTIDDHLAKAQFYRWYQLYERPITNNRVQNQLDILDNDIIITSAAGQQKGKQGYPARLALFKGWENAHHVQSVEVTSIGDGSYKLTANIEYQNIKPNGEKNSYRLNYDTRLQDTDSLLPQFTEITIKPTGVSDLTFEDAYPTNRALSLMHYFLALMEKLDGNVAPFKELLAPEFAFNFSSANNNIQTVEALSAWLNTVPSQLKQSSHYPENFSVTVTKEGQYLVSVDFDWYGITKSDQKMTAKTRHSWVIIDNPEERFARLKSINVEAIKPFQQVK